MPKKSTAKKVNKVPKKDDVIEERPAAETKPLEEAEEEAAGTTKEIDPDLVDSLFEEPLEAVEEDELDEFGDPLLDGDEEEESAW